MLVTLDDIKTWLGMPLAADAQKDALLTSIIKAVENAVCDYCETRFEPVAVVGELLDARRSDTIVTRHSPILSVQRLAIWVEADGTGGTELEEGKDFDARSEALYLRWTSAPQGRSLIRVDYTHGYSAVPDAVKMAVTLGVEAFWLRRARKSTGIAGRSKDGESESYVGAWDAKSGLPSEVIGLLSEYRSMDFPVGMATRNR